jgi:hypothetical protein
MQGYLAFEVIISAQQASDHARTVTAPSPRTALMPVEAVTSQKDRRMSTQLSSKPSRCMVPSER